MNKKIVAYVGNDVHMRTISIAVFEGYSKEPIIEKKILNEKSKVLKFYKKLAKKYEIKSCYEASGCGYVFHRWLKGIGVLCEVIAPSSIKKSNSKVKTDKIDAKKLAKDYRNNDLKIVHVPTGKEESLRGIIRLRDQIVKTQSKAKQHILKFLQAKGIVYREGKNWTLKHRRFLKTIKFDLSADEYILRRHLEMLEHVEMERESIDKKIHDIAFEEKDLMEQVAKLRCFRGIDVLTGISLVTEIIDFKRFGNPKQIMSFVGLVPGIESSGDMRKTLGITKSGNSRVRRLLVEAAWHYRHKPGRSESLKKRQEGQDIRIIQHCWRAQKRLHKKYVTMYMKGKCKQKVVTAVARELIGFIWAVMNEKPEARTI